MLHRLCHDDGISFSVGETNLKWNTMMITERQMDKWKKKEKMDKKKMDKWKKKGKPLSKTNK